MSQSTTPSTLAAPDSLRAIHPGSMPVHDLLVVVFIVTVSFIVFRFTKIREAFKLIPAAVETEPEELEVLMIIENRKVDLRRIEPLVLSKRLALIYSEMAISLDQAECEMRRGQYRRALSLERRAMRAFHAFNELFHHYVVNYPNNLNTGKAT